MVIQSIIFRCPSFESLIHPFSWPLWLIIMSHSISFSNVSIFRIGNRFEIDLDKNVYPAVLSLMAVFSIQFVICKDHNLLPKSRSNNFEFLKLHRISDGATTSSISSATKVTVTWKMPCSSLYFFVRYRTSRPRKPWFGIVYQYIILDNPL